MRSPSITRLARAGLVVGLLLSAAAQAQENVISQPVTTEERQAYLELSATLENISGP